VGGWKGRDVLKKTILGKEKKDVRLDTENAAGNRYGENADSV